MTNCVLRLLLPKRHCVLALRHHRSAGLQVLGKLCSIVGTRYLDSTLSLWPRCSLNISSYTRPWLSHRNSFNASRRIDRWRSKDEKSTWHISRKERVIISRVNVSNLPFFSRQVVFLGENIPIHPHIYSNGHICLSILTEDWSPALSVQAICLSVISMLSSCKEKVREAAGRPPLGRTDPFAVSEGERLDGKWEGFKSFYFQGSDYCVS